MYKDGSKFKTDKLSSLRERNGKSVEVNSSTRASTKRAIMRNLSNRNSQLSKPSHRRVRSLRSRKSPFDYISARKELWPEKKDNRFAPLYKPNHEYCKKRLNSLCIPFEKMHQKQKVIDHPSKTESPNIGPKNLKMKKKS